MEIYTFLNKYLPSDMIAWLKSNGKNATDITLIKNQYMFITENGTQWDSPFFITKEKLTEIFERMCKGSVYSNQNTLKRGFIIIDNGIRVGVAGEAVTDHSDAIIHMRNIQALNIRVPRFIKDAAKEIIPHLIYKNTLCNTLIIAPPSRGKTTILRSLALWCGDRYRTCVVDERNEISNGFESGKYTTVISNADKRSLINMAVRAMAPQVIITDEIAPCDEEAIRKAINFGVKIISTIHGFGLKDLESREGINMLVRNGDFQRTVILSSKNKPGTVERIIYAEGEICD